MVDLALLQSISYIAGALGVCVAAAYYMINLRETRKTQQLQLETRQVQLFIQLYNDFRKPENLLLIGKAMQMNWRDYDDVMKKYDNVEHMEDRIPYASWSMYYQEIGVLLKEGYIDIKLVAQFLPDAFRGYWEKFKPIILEHRVRNSYPQYFAGMEYLYNEFCKHRGHALS